MKNQNNFKQTKWILQRGLVFLKDFLNGGEHANLSDKEFYKELIAQADKCLKDTNNNYFAQVVLLEVLKTIEEERMHK